MNICDIVQQLPCIYTVYDSFKEIAVDVDLRAINPAMDEWRNGTRLGEVEVVSQRSEMENHEGR